MKYDVGAERLAPDKKPGSKNKPKRMPGFKNYDMGLRENTRLHVVDKQLQHNRPFSWFRNNREMPITPLTPKQPAGAHNPFCNLEALATDEALDTH